MFTDVSNLKFYYVPSFGKQILCRIVELLIDCVTPLAQQCEGVSLASG